MINDDLNRKLNVNNNDRKGKFFKQSNKQFWILLRLSKCSEYCFV